MSNRFRLFAVLAAVAVGAFAFNQVATAGEEAPATKPAEAPKAEAPKTETPKAEAPATKTPTPVHSLLFWVAKQVAPTLECPCAATPEGEKAWRTWFAGGKDVALAPLRDQLVADGWTADKFVTFFQEKAKASRQGDCAKGDCAKGDCAKGDCAKSKDGCCQGKGERGDGKPCCGGCNKDKDAAKADAPKTEPAPAPPAAKP